MVNETQWVTMGADVRATSTRLAGTQRGRHQVRRGQYFTPRALIRAMVECVRPEPNKTIADPACGTGGFFLAAYDFLVDAHQMDKKQKRSSSMRPFMATRSSRARAGWL